MGQHECQPGKSGIRKKNEVVDSYQRPKQDGVWRVRWMYFREGSHPHCMKAKMGSASVSSLDACSYERADSGGESSLSSCSSSPLERSKLCRRFVVGDRRETTVLNFFIECPCFTDSSDGEVAMLSYRVDEGTSKGVGVRDA